MKKKILLVVTRSHYGGAQKYVHILATMLKDDGHNVCVAVGENGSLVDKLKNDGVRVHKIPNLKREVSIFSELKVFFYLLKILRKERPDILHLNSSKIGGIGSLAGRIAGIRNIVFTIHGFAFNYPVPHLSKIFYKISYWLTFILCHKVVSVSKNILEDVKKWIFVKDKIVVIPNGIPIPIYTSKEEAIDFLSEKTGVNFSGKRIIGTIAELQKVKGVNLLIDSAQTIVDKYPDVLFVVIGNGDQRQYLEKQVAENGLKNKVFLMGHIDQAAQYVKGFDIFVLPSISEAFPLVLLEAGYAKLPVIASNIAEMPEIVIQGAGTLTKAGDSRDISNAISNYLDNSGLARKHGEALYHHIQQNFSVNRMYRETIQTY